MNRLGTESAFDVLAKAKRLEAQGRQIIHLEIGQPDFQTPSIFVKRHSERWKMGIRIWSCCWVTRAAWSDRWACLDYKRHWHFSWWSRGHPGAKTDYLFTLLALVDEGDEVIYPDPGFPIYESVINFVGKRSSLTSTRKRWFSLSYWRFGWCSFWADTVINLFPQNPTGGFWEKMTWKWSRIWQINTTLCPPSKSIHAFSMKGNMKA